MNHISLIHGIRTGLTDPNWTQLCQNFLELRMAQVTVETESYPAGPFAPWNLWVTNPRYARAYAGRIAAFHAEHGLRRAECELMGFRTVPLRVHLVAHSNGTNIAVEVVKRLAKAGTHVETLILVGSAIHSEVERSGLALLIGANKVRRVIAYCGGRDGVIRSLQSIPGFYGSLGTRGFERDGRPTGLRVAGYQPLTEGDWGHERHRFVTRWFPDFTHSEWMDEEHREETFRSFARDMELAFGEGETGRGGESLTGAEGHDAL